MADIGKFIKAVNDYSIIFKKSPNQLKNIYHYTSSMNAVIGITQGRFWATNMQDFRKPDEDKNEGVLILGEMLNYMREKQGRIVQRMREFISADELKEKFMSKYRTYVISTCVNDNSGKMWNNYAKESGYQIVFDKSHLLKSLILVEKNGCVRTDNNIFKHAPIVYDNNQHNEIIDKEYNRLLQSIKCDPDNMPDYMIEYVLLHLMYIGNFFKTDYYSSEEEYRILINTSEPKNEIMKLFLPEEKYNNYNHKHYIEVLFCPQAIQKIICRNEDSKNQLESQLDKEIGQKAKEFKIETRDKSEP